MSILSDEIDNDPEGKGYSALIENEPGRVVELLNAKTESKLGLLDRASLAMWAVANGMLGKFEDEAVDKTSPLRDSALAILYVLKGATSGIDFSLQANLDGFGAWISLGKMTEEQKNAALALSMQPASRAEVLGLPYVTEEMLRNR
jgi:hypothetical protein